jgi:hypothetical protein
MAITALGSARGTIEGVSTPGTATLTEAVSAGDTVFVAIQTYSMTSGIVAADLTDNKGNSWSLVRVSGAFAASDGQTALFMSTITVGASAGGMTITFTPHGTTWVSIIAEHFSGLSSTQDANTATASATGSTTVTLTTVFSPATTNANDLILVLSGNGNEPSDSPYTLPTGFTLPTNGRNDVTNGSSEVLAMAYQIVAATGTYSTAQTWRDSGVFTWQAIQVAYQASGGATDPMPLTHDSVLTQLQSPVYRT